MQKLCKKCGGIERYTSGNCKGCQKARDARRPRKKLEDRKTTRAGYPCIKCGGTKKYRGGCKDCQATNNALWHKSDPGRACAKTMKRKAAILQAIPFWIDHNAIEIIYRAAAVIRTTGFDVEVDHIIPLQSEVVCGLHWHKNMQILGSKENLRKKNRYWPDMP